MLVDPRYIAVGSTHPTFNNMLTWHTINGGSMENFTYYVVYENFPLHFLLGKGVGK